MKKLYVGTNTKMTKTIEDTINFISSLQTITDDLKDKITLFVIPSYTTLYPVSQIIDKSNILLGAQNMCWEEKGQFTGEISPLMLKEVNVDIAMIGHSERRHVFLEDDKVESLKVKAAIDHGFTPLLCIGETKEEKNYGIADEVLRKQLKIGFSQIDKKNFDKIMVAYEPVWAIGVSGEPASCEYAQAKHKVIKETLKELFGDLANDIPVLYGGSVNINNANEILEQESVDGLFVGRSAWDAENFNKLIRSALPIWEEKENNG